MLFSFLQLNIVLQSLEFIVFERMDGWMAYLLTLLPATLQSKTSFNRRKKRKKEAKEINGKCTQIESDIER